VSSADDEAEGDEMMKGRKEQDGDLYGDMEIMRLGGDGVSAVFSALIWDSRALMARFEQRAW